MVLSVVLTNASLAFSSIQFYQVARVLISPSVALLEYVVLGKKMGLKAAGWVGCICVGVGVVSYFDTNTATTTTTTTTNVVREDNTAEKQTPSGTSPLGVIFTLLSLIATALYAVMIKQYHEMTDCDSAQLLLNQSPISVLVMLYIIPFSDDITVWTSVPLGTWLIILLVSACIHQPSAEEKAVNVWASGS
jgi:solute carrier family 35, member E3